MDIERLEKKGYRLEEFAVIEEGMVLLRNVYGYCYFYSLTDKKCEIYEDRPLGCHIYPVMYMSNKSVTVDKLCPMGQTISEQELKTKRKILDQLVKTIDDERADY